jgi:VWFA-related protein
MALSVIAIAQQTPIPPTFRTGIDLVQVDVTVLDKDRHPVLGLQAEDFVVREDGQVRPITAFSPVTLPPQPSKPLAGWMREVSPDVVTNQTTKDGRLVVIMFDHTIGNDEIPDARRIAQAAVEQLRPGDMAAVLYSTVTMGSPQNFTADRSLLRRAIDQPFLGIGSDRGGIRSECRCDVCSLEVMTNVADSVREVARRRKILLYIGNNVPVNQPALDRGDLACFAEIKEARDKLLRAAGAANLTIHTFDSTLLQSGGYSASQSGGIPDVTDASGRSRTLIRQNDLAFFPGETGGRAIKNTNAPWEPIPQIFSETDSYYVLGFVPTPRNGPDRYHAISVEVNRASVKVYPRKGYYTQPPDAQSIRLPNGVSPPLAVAVSNPLPDTQIPMSVTAAAFATPGAPRATVAVLARAQEPVVPGRAAHVNALAQAYDREGAVLATHKQTVAIRPSPTGQPVFQYEVPSRLALKPGRHEIRVAVEDPEQHLTGSVYTYVEVPDFEKEPLTLSGIVLGTRSAASSSPFVDLFPLEPTAKRQFSTTERVAAFARVYQSVSDPSVVVAVTTRVVDASNRSVYEASTTLFENRDAKHSANYSVDLPLASLATGQYVLTVEATRKTKQTVRRSVMFSVR